MHSYSGGSRGGRKGQAPRAPNLRGAKSSPTSNIRNVPKRNCTLSFYYNFHVFYSISIFLFVFLKQNLNVQFL